MKINVSRISYSQTWEDTDNLRQALKVDERSRVLTVTSGGGAAFSLLCDNPQSLTSVDCNIAQTHLAMLISQAAIFFSYENFLSFIGITDSPNRVCQFNKILPLLTPESINFWEKRQKIINKGIIHCGKLERYFRFFGSRLLPHVVSQQGIKEILQAKSLEGQKAIYEKYWDNRGWNTLMRIFFGKSIFALFGRDAKYFTQSNIENTGREYKNRAAKGLTLIPTSSNWILEYILTGRYRKNIPPYYNFKQWSLWRKRLNKCSFITDKISTIIKQSQEKFTHVHLSDIFEQFTQKEFDNFWHRMIPQIKKRGRVCYWNNLTNHRLNLEITRNFNDEKSLARRLWEKDRAFFYGGFTLLEKR